jgi:hypothetical protein
MNCSECQDRLLARLDGDTVAEGAELERHLHDCADCRGLRATVARLDDGLRLLPTPTPPVNFAATVTSSVMAERHARQRRERWTQVAALAAAMLLAVGLGLKSGRFLSPQPGDMAAHTGHQPVTVSAGPSEETSPEATTPSPLELVTQSRSAVAALPRRVAEETALSQWSLSLDVLPELPRTTVAEPEAFEKATQSLTETRQGMATAWNAVEGPMRRATSAWSRLTPSLEKQ